MCHCSPSSDWRIRSVTPAKLTLFAEVGRELFRNNRRTRSDSALNLPPMLPGVCCCSFLGKLILPSSSLKRLTPAKLLFMEFISNSYRCCSGNESIRFTCLQRSAGFLHHFINLALNQSRPSSSRMDLYVSCIEEYVTEDAQLITRFPKLVNIGSFALFLLVAKRVGRLSTMLKRGMDENNQCFRGKIAVHYGFIVTQSITTGWLNSECMQMRSNGRKKKHPSSNVHLALDTFSTWIFSEKILLPWLIWTFFNKWTGTMNFTRDWIMQSVCPMVTNLLSRRHLLK